VDYSWQIIYLSSIADLLCKVSLGILAIMEIGRRLRELRESRNLSQGDLEARTGLLRCYTSRVENGHTVPSVETIEKYTNALGVALFAFFSNGVNAQQAEPLPSEDSDWGSTPRERFQNHKIVSALTNMSDQDRQLVLALVQRLTKAKRAKKHKVTFRAA
jgi:transcriptional regulator with XRE-family HTH domain